MGRLRYSTGHSWIRFIAYFVLAPLREDQREVVPGHITIVLVEEELGLVAQLFIKLFWREICRLHLFN
jgi:hypothetical protein